MNQDQPRHESVHSFLSNYKRLQHQMKHIMGMLLKEEALSQPLMFLLFALEERGAIKISEIAELFCITAGAATGMTDKVEEQGYVQRLRSDEDRRIVHVVLTELGKQKIEQMRQSISETMFRVFKDVPEARITEMDRSLHEMVLILEEYTK